MLWNNIPILCAIRYRPCIYTDLTPDSAIISKCSVLNYKEDSVELTNIMAHGIAAETCIYSTENENEDILFVLGMHEYIALCTEWIVHTLSKMSYLISHEKYVGTRNVKLWQRVEMLEILYIMVSYIQAQVLME